MAYIGQFEESNLHIREYVKNHPELNNDNEFLNFLNVFRAAVINDLNNKIYNQLNQEREDAVRYYKMQVDFKHNLVPNKPIE